MITTNAMIRDPFVLVEKGVYYVYGTGAAKKGASDVGYRDTAWICYKNTSGSLSGDWEQLEDLYVVPEDGEAQFWAPEVHRYKGAFYMFASYRSKTTGHRGCVILRSEKPEGPFVMITDGHATPKDWDSIDGTLYVDPDGQPWMVFVHEWTCMPDKVGTFAAARLSEDLTHFVSEPVELFRATDPAWAKGKITDGCFMYTTKDGQLLMLWSNSDPYGYSVGVARSVSGKVDSTEWTHDTDMLFSKGITGEYDGGHGMIFTDTDGTMYLSVHSPNGIKQGRAETAVFVPLVEENGNLIWKK